MKNRQYQLTVKSRYSVCPTVVSTHLHHYRMAYGFSSSPNPEPLNPNASPYVKLPPSPNTEQLPPALSNINYLPHDVYCIQPLNPPQVAAPTVNLAVPYFTDYHVDHQPRPVWAYQPGFGHYYPFREPFLVSYNNFASTGAVCLYTGAQLGNLLQDYISRDNPRGCLNKIVDPKLIPVSGEKGVVQYRLDRGKCVAAPGSRRDFGFSRQKFGLAKNKNKVGSGFSERSRLTKILAFSGVDDVKLKGKTTLMIRNIPNQFKRHNLLQILDDHCLEENKKAQLSSDPIKSEYDFMYLPMDFRTGGNFGYAFVNFTDVIAAARFFKALHKYEWKVFHSKKVCEISCAMIQGKDNLINYYKNTSFPCHTDSYLPVALSPPSDGLVHSRLEVLGWRSTPATK